MAHFLVIGGTGYLGREVCRVAREEGHDVTATGQRGEPVPGVGNRLLDVCDADAVARCIDEVCPDVVVNAAYAQEPAERARAVNADGAGHVARAVAAAGVRLVHMSSDVVFAGRDPAPLTEDAPIGPVHDYGRAKADGEAQVAAACPAAAIVRTSLIYGGPGAPRSRHEDVVLAAARGDSPMTFYTDELRCPVQVTDLAMALVALAATDHAGPLNLAGPQVVSRHAFARAVARAEGGDISAVRGRPAPPERPLTLILSGACAQRLMPDVRLRSVDAVLGPRR